MPVAKKESDVEFHFVFCKKLRGVTMRKAEKQTLQLPKKDSSVEFDMVFGKFREKSRLRPME
jgi:hypothetical protein